MTKVMIVDDEVLVRVGLKASIDWESYGLQLIGDYENGKQAYEFALKNCPDIIITDIVMPEMNGLDLIKELNKINNRIKFIILTSHEEFIYAQEAVKLGAADYMLKLSLDIDKLLKLLVDLKEECELYKDNVTLETSPGVNLYQALLCEDSKEIKKKYKELMTGTKYLLLLSVDGHGLLPLEQQLDGNQFVINGIRNIISDLLQKEAYSDCSYISNGEFFIVIKTEKQILYLYTIAQHIQKSLETYFNIDCTIIISNPFEDIFQFKTVIKRLQVGIEYRFYEGKKSLLIDQDTSIDVNDKLESEYWSVQNELRAAVELGNKTRAIGIINDIIHKAYELKLDPIYVRKVFIQIFLVLEKQLKAVADEVHDNDGRNVFYLLNNLEYFEDIQHLIINLINNIIWYKDNIKPSIKKEIIETIEYIRTNFSKDLKLEQLSRHCNMNSSYFSRLFKEKTGENISNFILRIRMEKAKVLLLEREERFMYEIANQVGYENFNNFSKLFKKYSGMTPKEFRSRHISPK